MLLDEVVVYSRYKQGYSVCTGFYAKYWTELKLDNFLIKAADVSDPHHLAL